MVINDGECIPVTTVAVSQVELLETPDPTLFGFREKSQKGSVDDEFVSIARLKGCYISCSVEKSLNCHKRALDFFFPVKGCQRDCRVTVLGGFWNF